MLIKELTLLTTDITATRKFYHGLMGFPVLKEDNEHISFKIGNSILFFQRTKLYAAPFYHVAFTIPNNKLIEATDWVTHRTSLLPYSAHESIADFKGWNAKAFYFHDNQQNILEFITHFDLQTRDQKKFSAASVENICEIGIVTTNVSETCADIHNAYGIPYFVKGPRFNDFAAMGDSYGLLIISQIKRGWLPTQRPAEKFPVKIIMESKGNIKELFFN